MLLPPESVIQLPTGYLRLVEAMSLIQEHTSIPIVMPEELASEEVRDIHWSRRRADHRRGGVVVTVGRVTVPLGSCYRVFFHRRIAEVHELEDGSRRVVVEPAGDGPDRVEERLGPAPGSPEPPTWMEEHVRVER